MNCVTSFYENNILLHFSSFPLVITLIGQKTANVGVMMYSVDQLRAALEPVREAVESSEYNNRE